MDKELAMQDMKKTTDPEDSKKKERHIVSWSQEVIYLLISLAHALFYSIFFFFCYFAPLSLTGLKKF